MGEEKAPGRIQLVSVGMSTVGTAPGGDVFHSVPFTGVVRSLPVAVCADARASQPHHHVTTTLMTPTYQTAKMMIRHSNFAPNFRWDVFF
jgi:hypothetical protein